MKKRVLYLFFCFVCYPLFSNNILEGKTYSSDVNGLRQIIEFSDGTLKYTAYYDGDKDEEYSTTYRVEENEGISYLVLGKESEKWLAMLSEDYIFLYKEDGEPFFDGWWTGSKFDPTLFNYYSKDLFETDSFLIEEIDNKKISYPSANLGTIAIPYPWVEGDENDGVGVHITGLFNSGERFQHYLVFSNGYVSYKRPDLYRKNGRIKKIRITDIELGKSKDVDIKDTPNLQYIYVSDIITGNKGFTIEILETYSGSKYNDTCINFLGVYYVHNTSPLFDYK